MRNFQAGAPAVRKLGKAGVRVELSCRGKLQARRITSKPKLSPDMSTLRPACDSLAICVLVAFRMSWLLAEPQG